MEEKVRKFFESVLNYEAGSSPEAVGKPVKKEESEAPKSVNVSSSQGEGAVAIKVKTSKADGKLVKPQFTAPERVAAKNVEVKTESKPVSEEEKETPARHKKLRVQSLDS